MKIILLGAPGSGKDTQGELLAKKYKIPLIATGDILRNAISVHSSMGKKVEAYLKKGDLIPDQLIGQIVKARLKHKDCKLGFILDGFPRDITQTGDLEKITNIDYVFYIQVSKRKVVKRLSSRRVCTKCDESYNLITNPPKMKGICDKCKGKLIQREDDKKSTIKHRIKVYLKETKPVISFYRKKRILKKINGDISIEEVSDRISKVLLK